MEIQYIGFEKTDVAAKNSKRLRKYVIECSHVQAFKSVPSEVEDVEALFDYVYPILNISVKYGGKLDCSSFSYSELFLSGLSTSALIKLITRICIEEPYVYIFGGSFLRNAGGLVVLTRIPDDLIDIETYCSLRIKGKPFVLTSLKCFVKYLDTKYMEE